MATGRRGRSPGARLLKGVWRAGAFVGVEAPPLPGGAGAPRAAPRVPVPRRTFVRRLTGDVQVQVVQRAQAVQVLRGGAAALLHAQRGRRAAPRAGGRGGPAWAPLALPLHGGGCGRSGGRHHGPASPGAHPGPRQPRARGAAGSERRRRGGGHPSGGCGAGARGGARPTAPAPLPPAASPGPAPQPGLQRLLPLPAPPSPPLGARRPLGGCCEGRLGLPRVPTPARRGRSCGGGGGGGHSSPRCPGTPGGLFRGASFTKKGPQPSSACRLRPLIGQGGVTSQRGAFLQAGTQ